MDTDLLLRMALLLDGRLTRFEANTLLTELLADPDGALELLGEAGALLRDMEDAEHRDA
jgi:hypothetical protein